MRYVIVIDTFEQKMMGELLDSYRLDQHVLWGKVLIKHKHQQLDTYVVFYCTGNESTFFERHRMVFDSREEAINYKPLEEKLFIATGSKNIARAS